MEEHVLNKEQVEAMIHNLKVDLRALNLKKGTKEAFPGIEDAIREHEEQIRMLEDAINGSRSISSKGIHHKEINVSKEDNMYVDEDIDGIYELDDEADFDEDYPDDESGMEDYEGPTW